MPAGDLVELEDARRAVLAALSPPAREEVELDAALGRILAEDIAAEQPLPPFDSSAMDGYAVRADDVGTAAAGDPIALRVVGESRAGRPAEVTLGGGEAIAISTGAVIPDGADAVVRVERTHRRDGLVEVLAPVCAGAEVRRAGEDVGAGETVLRRGTALGPAALGMLASLGRARVTCGSAPRVAVLATGDELLGGAEPARRGAIRDSNSHSLAALARCSGAVVVQRGTVGDDAAATRSAIERGVRGAEAVVISGGVSVGEHDHVRPSLEQLGARERFWGLALRPGHPTWFGTVDRVPVFGLPGNPVSAMVTFILLAAPALRALQGAAEPVARLTASLAGGYEKPAGRAHALRCRLRATDGGWHAELTGPQGSHVLSSMLAADGLAIVPSAATAVRPGGPVEVLPLPAWQGGAR